MAELVSKNNYLQERNWKLQMELEVLKGMVTPETMATVYPVKYKEFMVCEWAVAWKKFLKKAFLLCESVCFVNISTFFVTSSKNIIL